MDKSAQLEGCVGIPSANLHLKGQWSSTLAVKEDEESTVVTFKDRHYGGTDNRSSHEHLDVGQTTNILVKEELAERLPTPTGGSLYSDGCGRVSTALPHLKAHRNIAVAVMKEAAEANSTLTWKGLDCEDAHHLSASHRPLSEVQTAAVVVKQVPEETLPTLMDKSAQLEGCVGIPSANLHLKGQWSSTLAVKEDEESTVATFKGRHYGGTDNRSSHEHLDVGQTTNILVKEELAERLPTPTGGSLYSDGCGRVSTALPHLKAHRNIAVAVMKEAAEANSTLTCKGLDCEDARHLSASHRPLSEVQTVTVVVKQEQDEESTVSTSEGWQCGDADDLSPPDGHLDGCQTSSVLVKEEPEEILPTPAGESLHSDDCSGLPYTPPNLEEPWDNAGTVKREMPAARQVLLSLLKGNPATEPTGPSLQSLLSAITRWADSGGSMSGTVSTRANDSSKFSQPVENGAVLGAQRGARREGRWKGAGACEWDDSETKLLLECYEKYLPQIGHLKKFRNKKEAFTQISEDLLTQLKSEKSPGQCITRFKTVQKRKGRPVRHNRSRMSSLEVTYEEELDRIQKLDDVIEAKVVGDVHAAPCCSSSSSASSYSPAGAGSAGSSSLLGTAVAAASSGNTLADSEEIASRSTRKDRSSRTGTARFRHMQEFFEKLERMQEAKFKRQEERDKKKEQRHEERMKELEARRDERRAMHAEKMRLLSLALNILKSE